MSHQVDLASHGITKAWNGHWQYPDWLWNVIVGARPYLINRHPASAHERMLEAAGFRPQLLLYARRSDGVRIPGMPEHDATCSGLFVQARKPS